MRLFIAINFNDEAKAKLLQAQMALRSASAGGNFTRPENLHLTLVFLGETPPGRMREIQKAMNSIKDIHKMDHPVQPFALQFEGVGKFGDIWWIGIRQNLTLNRLQYHLAQRLREAGFVIEKRPFRPHLTLAREMKLLEDAKPAETGWFSTQVQAIHLMKSERVNGKLIYTPFYETRL